MFLGVTCAGKHGEANVTFPQDAEDWTTVGRATKRHSFATSPGQSGASPTGYTEEAADLTGSTPL